jgi:hypothetical protein
MAKLGEPLDKLCLHGNGGVIGGYGDTHGWMLVVFVGGESQ